MDIKETLLDGLEDMILARARRRWRRAVDKGKAAQVEHQDRFVEEEIENLLRELDKLMGEL